MEEFENFFEELEAGTLNDLPGQLVRSISYCLDRCSVKSGDKHREFYKKIIGSCIKNHVKFDTMIKFRSSDLTPPSVLSAFQSVEGLLAQNITFSNVNDPSNIVYYNHDIEVLILNMLPVNKHLRYIEKTYGI